MAKSQSVEPNIADLVNGWLKSYGLDYKLEQESLNEEIDKALDEYKSKSGGSGGNRPDAKLLLQDKSLNYYPILIEYKGYKDKLVKLDGDGRVDNRTNKNEPNYKNINNFAVNGAVHYANAILHYAELHRRHRDWRYGLQKHKRLNRTFDRRLPCFERQFRHRPRNRQIHRFIFF